MKTPLTPAGIEPATFRFVAQHLSHCATAVRTDVLIVSAIMTWPLFNTVFKFKSTFIFNALKCGKRQKRLSIYQKKIMSEVIRCSANLYQRVFNALEVTNGPQLTNCSEYKMLNKMGLLELIHQQMHIQFHIKHI